VFLDQFCLHLAKWSIVSYEIMRYCKVSYQYSVKATRGKKMIYLLTFLWMSYLK